MAIVKVRAMLNLDGGNIYLKAWRACVTNHMNEYNYLTFQSAWDKICIGFLKIGNKILLRLSAFPQEVSALLCQ